MSADKADVFYHDIVYLPLAIIQREAVFDLDVAVVVGGFGFYFGLFAFERFFGDLKLAFVDVFSNLGNVVVCEFFAKKLSELALLLGTCLGPVFSNTAPGQSSRS